MADVASFAELAAPFEAVVRAVNWPAMTTVDGRGRPRTRIVHPVWEGHTGWVFTGRHSHKEKHLARSPYVSLAYVNDAGMRADADQVYADCRTDWVDELAEKRRVWELFKTLPPPYGYDPALFFPSGPDDPEIGLLKLTPWRIEVFSLAGAMQGGAKVWRQAV